MGADASSRADMAMDGMEARPWPPYDALRATRLTGFAPEKPVREVRMTLDGDMERYVWFLNGRALSESDDIHVREGEIVRFILINRTMMHHPMHLHGHFFRVVNGQGARSPLKHTVDVAPMSTTVIEFDAVEPGDWFFHCHLLYHMMNGMARVVHYEDFALDRRWLPSAPGCTADEWHAMGRADLLSSMTEGFLMLSSTRTTLTADWEFGWQGVRWHEWETLVTGSRYINSFWSVFAGVDLIGAGNEPGQPAPSSASARCYPSILSCGPGRLRRRRPRQAREALPLTPRLEISGAVRYDTHDLWEGQAGLRLHALEGAFPPRALALHLRPGRAGRV